MPDMTSGPIACWLFGRSFFLLLAKCTWFW